jgi:hypothetical protein
MKPGKATKREQSSEEKQNIRSEADQMEERLIKFIKWVVEGK